jgi:hypothetical protein
MRLPLPPPPSQIRRCPQQREGDQPVRERRGALFYCVQSGHDSRRGGMGGARGGVWPGSGMGISGSLLLFRLHRLGHRRIWGYICRQDLREGAQDFFSISFRANTGVPTCSPARPLAPLLTVAHTAPLIPPRGLVPKLDILSCDFMSQSIALPVSASLLIPFSACNFEPQLFLVKFNLRFVILLPSSVLINGKH